MNLNYYIYFFNYSCKLIKESVYIPLKLNEIYYEEVKISEHVKIDGDHKKSYIALISEENFPYLDKA